jgi:DNA-binding transcriptional ArsR family regulator
MPYLSMNIVNIYCQKPFFRLLFECNSIMNFEEDTYDSIFSALKHPIRRKILRTLDQAPATYTEMLNTLGNETGLLNFHLESLSARGDRALGIRTVAVSKGAKFASWLSALLYISAVAASFVPVYLDLVSIWYVPFVAFTDLGLFYLSIRLVREPSRENSRWVKNRVLIFMLSGLLGFLVGNIF